MDVDLVPACLCFSVVLTYILQLWTGIAIAGWPTEKSLVYRSKKPGPYWFIMAFQTLVLIGVPVLLAFAD
ncbi:hypothetical protein [Novipirellula artificiosorum]|uniref:Uncharacterized protein n=1 Tax=Novipirellula artificiosorum TaxID=2528016 RepID=A0A5C6DG04_9BACT|nr:hypothetical protein [Novipirellula artificiosorum]TWU36213.1 hypothetical protein Poly41_39680 [Novipirellula artificiosorum]